MDKWMDILKIYRHWKKTEAQRRLLWPLLTQDPLTSPSVASSSKSFLLLIFRVPMAALTSTPRGASMVRVLVGDSNLRIISPRYLVAKLNRFRLLFKKVEIFKSPQVTPQVHTSMCKYVLYWWLRLIITRRKMPKDFSRRGSLLEPHLDFKYFYGMQQNCSCCSCKGASAHNS